jgi:hypothetical protein
MLNNVILRKIKMCKDKEQFIHEIRQLIKKILLLFIKLYNKINGK